LKREADSQTVHKAVKKKGSAADDTAGRKTMEQKISG
jgi:hypothetical protein